MRPATSWVHYTTNCNTQSSAPEDGRSYRSKYAELIGIINKLLLLHLFGCLYYLYRMSIFNLVVYTTYTACQFSIWLSILLIPHVNFQTRS